MSHDLTTRHTKLTYLMMHESQPPVSGFLQEGRSRRAFATLPHPPSHVAAAARTHLQLRVVVIAQLEGQEDAVLHR